MTARSLLLLFLSILKSSLGYSLITSSSSVSDLLAKNADRISTLKSIASSISPSKEDIPTNDIFYLRYCISNDDNDDESIQMALKETMNWRCNGIGKTICDSAKAAFEAATTETTTSSSTARWNNDPVRNGAPHASIINQYINPTNIVTTSSNNGDLLFCIRSGQIDDIGLMSSLTVDQMMDYFLYCKEINRLVADDRSLQTNRLVSLLAVNDLSGVKLIGGDANFRKALGASSTKANQLYPSFSGPTLLLNLPPLLGALVKLFTPIFPEAVRKKLKFGQGPLADVKDLISIVQNGEVRDEFLKQIDDLVNDK